MEPFQPCSMAWGPPLIVVVQIGLHYTRKNILLRSDYIQVSEYYMQCMHKTLLSLWRTVFSLFVFNSPRNVLWLSTNSYKYKCNDQSSHSILMKKSRWLSLVVLLSCSLVCSSSSSGGGGGSS